MVLALGMIADRARRDAAWCSRRRTGPRARRRVRSSAGRYAVAGGMLVVMVATMISEYASRPNHMHQPLLLSGAAARSRSSSSPSRRAGRLRFPATTAGRGIHGHHARDDVDPPAVSGPAQAGADLQRGSPTWCRPTFLCCWWFPRSPSICCSGEPGGATIGCWPIAPGRRCSCRCCSRSSGSSASSCSGPPPATSSSRPISGPTWSSRALAAIGSGACRRMRRQSRCPARSRADWASPRSSRMASARIGLWWGNGMSRVMR